ncbi:MAG TPA: LysR family transcriptional regulator [Candidatus Mediterraneibacter tabaqchaliae]|uniref:LysR family transcriptional regulator n=1 Tax=Candidatus Mediterraneibacter tabaqchaliae TaxID=2838689 RepID=A0A9D2R2C2_9FIRM|nr:LysR family transcriptional regulator [Candidatus Mediterraneibacter tabaqchaliae]
MTLRHMKIFEAVFRHSNITKAAEELHLAQPSVSVAVRELEEYYGICLFERLGRRIVPTELGKEFYGYALHIVSLFDEMEQKIRNWDALGVIRIGASITIGTHILPPLLKQYQALYPELRTEVTIGKSAVIEQHILENKIDIGLIENQSEHPDINVLPFMEDYMQAIVAPDHPLAKYSQVTLEQLAQYPFLMREKGSAGREILDACFALEQITVHPLWESASTQAIVRGVAEGLGVAVLPCLLVRKNIEEHTVKMIPFPQPLTRKLNLIWHRSKYLTDNMNAFIELCKKSGSEW